MIQLPMSVCSSVALLAEGVDRNLSGSACCPAALVSPSSRRAWIEIRWNSFSFLRARVALLAEGVDRN